jgi:hypothetical protein
MPYRKPDNNEVRKTFLNDKPKKKGQGSHKVHKIDTPEYQAKVEAVYDYIKKGWRSNEIYAMMLIDDETLNERGFNELLRYAYVFGENALHKDREYVFQLHMDRYEKMYEKSLLMVDSWNKPLDVRQHWHIMTAKYANALKALESKEKLIGLHDKSVSLEFNEQKAVLVEEKDDRGAIPGYDIEKLTLEEQKELLALIREARTVPLEGIQRVTIKKTVIEINTETGERNVEQDVEIHDITFEEMPAPVVNKFTEIKDPEEEPVMEIGPIMIDHVKDQIKQTDVEAMKGNLNKKTIDTFREKLKQKRNK